MHKFIFRISVLTLLSTLMLNSNVFGQEFVEGREYEDLGTQAVVLPDGRVEVAEFFWYGCPSCFNFEPHLLAWDIPANIHFQNIPATSARNWIFHAHVYYAFEVLGLKEQLMQKFYDALHVDRIRINNPDQLHDWAAQQQGIDAESLVKALNSFAVMTKVSQAELLASQYRVKVTPTLIIGSKYKTKVSMAGSPQRTIEVAEFLANKVLAEQ